MSDDMTIILNAIQGLREDMERMEGSIRGDMAKMENSIREDMEKMENSIREDMTKMETSLTRKIEDGDNAIRLILENDIVPKINVIAENHLNLYHGLENLRQDVQKYELLPIRMSLLEKEVFKQPKL